MRILVVNPFGGTEFRGRENLEKIKQFAQTYDKLTKEDRKEVVRHIEKLQERIDAEPKSMKWKMRNRVGDKKQWYEDVEEVVPFIQSLRILFIFVGSLILFSETANFLNYLGIVMILSGLYLVLSEKGLKIPKIDRIFFLMLIGVLLGVVHAFLVKGLLFNVKPIDLAIMMYLSTTLILFIYQILFRKRFLKSFIDFKQKISKILLASFFGAIGTLLLYLALSLGDASKIYPIAGVQFIFVFIIGSIFLRREFRWYRLIGIITVFAGVYLVSL